MSAPMRPWLQRLGLVRAPADTGRLSLRLWQALTPAQRRQVLALKISGRQTDYAGTVEQAVALCEADNGEQVAGLAILLADAVVGFFLLKRQRAAPAWAGPGAVVIAALRLDRAHQGQGLGSRAMLVLRPWVLAHWPGSTELALSVDQSNHAGQRAYLKAGFQDLGRGEAGPVGWVRFMALKL